MLEPYWKTWLEKYKDHGAHFHGEGDFLLEVRPTPESQDWFWVWRTETRDDDETRNEMCREMDAELREN